jgi:hypothetical protein
LGPEGDSGSFEMARLFIGNDDLPHYFGPIFQRK